MAFWGIVRARILTSALAVAAVVSALLVVQAPPPAAALSPGIDFSADDLPTWQTNGTVWGIDAAQGKVVAGGTFSQVRPPTGQPGTPRSQNALIILDGETGAPDQCQFSMSLSGGTPTVRAVQASPDGSVVYIGGNFSNVGGVNVARIAALNIVDCTVLPFRAPLPSSTVTALAIHGDTLYAGGLFNTVGSAQRRAFAAFNATTGALLDWRADAVRTRTNLPPEVAQARAVQVSPDGTKVVVGGDLFEINGVYSHSIAMVTAATGPNGAGGDVLRTYPSGFFPDTSVTKTIVDGGDGRFYIGNEGTGGGVFDGKAAFSWDTGDQIWRDTCLGAVQDLLVRNGTIYSASHHHDCAGINAFPDGIRRYFNAQNADTMEFLGWLPLGNDGIGEGIGPRGLTVVTGKTTGKDYLWSGGEFTRINGHDQQGLTRFGPDDVGAPPIPIVSAEATSDGTIQVHFRTVVDSDDDTLTYSVYRSGTSGPIWQGTARSLWWERPQVTFVDSNVTPGTNYTYRVTASDGTNTSGQSAPSSAVAIAATADYGSAVRALHPNSAWTGAAVGSWVVDSASDTSRPDGFNGLLMDGAAQTTADSAVPNNTTAFSFDGSNDYIRSDQLRPGPTNYTVSAWIKTTTNRGGKIIGFGNGQPNTGTNASRLSGSYDRHLYMANNGRVLFGVYTGSTVTITSPTALNDGQWHYVVGTQGPSGMRLYVDGVSVASNGVTAAQDYWGVWRVGGDQLNSWPSRPSSNFFSGLIDEIAVYPTALGSFDVARLYQASGRSLGTNTAPTDQYGAAVFNADPDLYWRFDDTSGPAVDSSLFAMRPGTYSNGTERGVTGVLPGNTAVTTSGTSNGTVATSQSMSPSAVFTAEAWFKTTTNAGGKIFGFENTRTGNGTSYDKHLYMADDGRLVWSSYIGHAEVITSADAYNDGVWHHVAAVIDSTGRALFVDGEQVAQNDVTGAESGDGYWRVGGGNLSSWPDRPSSDYFAGTIDEFAVYSQSLPAATVAAHYALGIANAAAPGVPAQVEAAPAGHGVQLSWSTAESGFGVQEYRVYRSSEPDFAVSEETLVGTTQETAFTDASVTPGETYYRVVAVGPGEKAGEPSDAIGVNVPDTTAPSVPDGLVAVVDGSAVGLTWTASTDDVGVTSYEVHRGDSADFTPSAATMIASVNDASFTDVDRPASTVYYRIVAVDVAGNMSDPSQSVEAVVPDVTAPTTPSDVSAVTGGDPEITVTWTASDDDLGVTGYDVYRGIAADFTVDETAKIARVTTTSYTDSDVTPGTWYYRIVAVDEAGNGSPASEVASATVADVTAPTVPTDLAGTTSGNDVSLSWTAASDDVAVEHYEIHRGASADFEASAATRIGESTSTSYTDADQPAGEVFYRVVAVDPTGNASAASDAAQVTVPDVTAPSTPTVMAVLDDGAASLSWSDSTDDVGVTGYQVHRAQTADFTVSAATKIADVTGTTYVDDTVTAGAWFYRVVAVDAAGNTSPASDQAQVVVPDTTAPSAPADLAASAAGQNVQLSWSPSSDDVAVTGYEVHRSATAGFTPSEATLIGTSSEAGYADMEVEPGEWHYLVVALDAAGNASGASNEASVEVLDIDDTAPSTPNGLVAAVDGSDVSLTWSVSTDDVGVTGYQVHRGSTADFTPTASSLLATVTDPAYVDSGRTAGTWYYRVAAIDAAGNVSAPSDSAEAVVADASGPTAPTDVAADLNGSIATVTWTESTDDVGVAGYRLYRGAVADFEVSAELLVTEVTGLSAQESALPAGTWFYKVVAFDGAGNTSLPSDAAQVSVADTSAPTQVTGVVAQPGQSGVTVGWQPADDDVAVTGYRVHRGSAADFTVSSANRVAEVADAPYVDAAPSGIWFYKVVAVDAAGNAGPASDAAQAIVADVSAPSAPSGVSASVSGADVGLSWTASTDDVGVVGYQVHRGSSAGFAVSTSSKVADVTGTSFTDADRPVGTWFYRVVAVDAAGNASGASAEVSAAVTGSGEPVTVNVPVVEDAMVYGIIPTTNFGSDSQLSSRGGTASPIQSFLSVELPTAPAGTALTGAELRVRTSTDPTATSTDMHQIHLVSGAWSESGVTWNNRPTSEGALLGALGAAPATNTPYTASLSATGLSGVLGTTQTLRISSTGADNLRLWSSEAPNTTYRPVLVLTFTPGSGPVADVTAPSVPSNASASAVGASVVVSWTASTDDVGVVGYQVHRGSSAGFAVSTSSKVADVTGTSFTDADRPVGTWFYRVVAVDAAGNASGASAEVSAAVTGSGEPVTVNVPVVEDAMVFGVLPSTNFGSDTQLSSRGGSSPIESFLSFDLPSAPAGTALTGAELRVRTSTDPTATSTDLHVVHLISDAWSESSVTWANRPTSAGSMLGALGATPATNTAYSASLSPNVLAGALGTHQTLRFSSSGADSLRLWSSEAANASYRPVLVLTFTPGTVPVEDQSAPSVPTGVSASVSGADVGLSWTASTDDVGVVGYQVHRGAAAGFAVSASSKIADAASTAFTDADRPAGTWYYRVVAVDAAGNASGASAEVSATVAGSVEPMTVTVPVAADAMVYGIIPGTNFGTDTQLSSRGGGNASPIESFLLVDLPSAPAGTVLSGAELRVRTSTDPTASSADSHAINLVSGSWSEASVTWNNRPTSEGALLGSLGAAPSTNTAYTASLSATGLSVVLGTTQTLRISSAGLDNIRLWSSEAPNATYRPVLVLTFTPAP
ncbi:CBM96 family carbohydrate-binding protein [Microbacterium suwonense]|uniref:CBM96 family carbohydrate-binding protein n=1 Tax=Microbacterium suwonense TaxID=683047 RepID=UPI002573973C|nr:DNRLRE domain-containing protein [Microbacterium suwonense]